MIGRFLRRPTWTIVTGASSNHAPALRNLLRSLTLCEVNARVVVYDLGLSPAEERAVRTTMRAADLRRFQFERYPPHVNIEVERGAYAWKPIIVSDVVREMGGVVLWLDAGDLVFGGLERVRRIIVEHGFYSPVTAGRVEDWTHPATLQCLKAGPEPLGERNRNGAIVGFDAGRSAMLWLVERWRECALVKECIAPAGSNRSNHRQDQAVLSVLVYQLRQTHPFKLVRRPVEISVHNDDLAFDGVAARVALLRSAPRARGAGSVSLRPKAGPPAPARWPDRATGPGRR